MYVNCNIINEITLKNFRRDKMEEDTISRDSHIKYNLESYLPYICECVDVKDLLLNLDYFTGGMFFE
jgi:hypothetical protein